MGIKAFLQKNISKYPKNLLELKFQQRKIRKLLIKLKNNWPDIEEYPSQLNLYEVLERIKKVWTEHKSILAIKKGDLKYIPWVLFIGDKPWLGEDELFYQKFSQHLTSRPDPNIIIRLISSFLFYYPTNVTTFASWLHLIEQLLENYNKIFWRLRDWYKRHNKWHIFKINSTKIIADKWLQQPTEDLFLEIGISGKIGEYKFVQYILKRILNNVYKKNREGNYLYINHLVSLLSKNTDLIGDNVLKKGIISSLLKPFINSDPPNEIRDIITNFLLKHLGDPRLEAENWQGIDDILVNVIKRWLSLESFNLFLDIIERTSDPKFHRRKNFWTPYFNLGYINEAWAILGRKAQNEISQCMNSNRNVQFRNFGILINPDPRQSVLLLKIADLIIAEWSHNGKCRIWHINNKHAPLLYKKEYFAPDLRLNADFEKVHLGAWEYDIAKKINEYTNVKHPILRKYYDLHSELEE